MVKAQEWLEENYPDKETESIYINQQLEGILDCSGYERLEYIFISTSVDRSKLEIKGGSYEGKETKIIPCIPTQEYINKEYPKNGTCIRENENFGDKNFGKTREEITKLDIKKKALEGELDLSDFKNLEELDCSDNYLTNLNLSNLAKLETLSCSDNYLTQIPYLPNPKKITDLRIDNNNINPSDLAIFSQMRNLERL
ncbi:15456_t:CDS:1 [Racocetra persica]|uniref:15456_t:CDS:1 n=1 Tax=Racocetra persica TaxID=160502 RepID=A0ACA9QG07_9GLOM|nr:15456_t:CDS:1 [Racocetra persica]